MDFSSASLASYHLNKLLDAGYVKQDEHSRYIASGEAVGDVLAGYSKIGSAIVPQSAFFAVLISILIAYFSYEALRLTSFVPYLVVAAVGAAFALCYETFRLWRRLAA
ncbi:MAG TPA: hypothetical protein VND40_06615 [Nitrososphaerales archaeon]|nr:hypothetical protein [Nitrososphaerales archaeon]